MDDLTKNLSTTTTKIVSIKRYIRNTLKSQKEEHISEINTVEKINYRLDQTHV